MKQLIILFLLLTITTASYTQSGNAALKNTTPVSREMGAVDGYLLHLPPGYHQNPQKRYPLIVYLHGTGERGNGSSDLYKIAKVGCPSRRAEEQGSLCFTVDGKEHCFIVISPQLRPQNNWTANNQERFWQHILEEADYRIDYSRVYLTGHSLGGNGTWEAAYADQNEPNRFAAIAPLSYWTNKSRLCRVADREIPVWAFCGTQDGRFIGHSRSAIKTLRECPRNPNVEIKFTEVKGAGHSITGPTYRTNHSMYNPNLYEWLLTKVKGSNSTHASAPAPPNQLSANAKGPNTIALTWTDRSADEEGFKVFRSTVSGNDFEHIMTLSTNKSSFQDQDLKASTKYYYKLQAFNTEGTSPYTQQVSATTEGTTQMENSISWTEIIGADLKYGQLLKTAAYGWGNSGAVSEETIPYGSDGWVSMRIEDPDKADLAFGLSSENINNNPTSIDFGFELSRHNRAFWIREKGDRRYMGSFSMGDVFKIERKASVIYYYQSGQLIATSNQQSKSALMADVALLHTGVTLFDGKMGADSKGNPAQYVNWVEVKGAKVESTRLVKTAKYGWGNAGAATASNIPAHADGWLQMTIGDASKANLAIGLSPYNPDDHPETVAYGFELSQYNNAYWKREGSQRTYLGSFDTGDVLRVERKGHEMRYLRNGNIIARSSISNAPELVGDVSLLHTGACAEAVKLYTDSENTQARQEATKPAAVDRTINLYPNPIGAAGSLHIVIEGYESEGKLMVYDMSGKLVVQQALTGGQNRLDFSHLQQSMYAYRLMINGQSVKNGVLRR
ncbi:fibronectin type III domain-containing protein [Marinoscillum furvescens]|uniref:Putative secreted protein (Por secretion system target) n=1 Tax=Marinoscillum furvescens DSM 4134 TaxID=1122208 RepID=A0A3D9L3F3_MARFU|nr:T9SS type A sorting domain-containing protein [Marinoscillum furvescens]RED97901.1 putative secreted protein (Por secretion system target) [Marinoscillum furvescens DSM 4134]